MRLSIFWAVFCLFFYQAAYADNVNITPEMPVRTLTLNGQTITISRIQDNDHRIKPEFTKTSRQCPPFCVHPIEISPKVRTLGELEVLDFLETQVATNKGLLIDSRIASWYAKGTIPGAINLPFTILDKTNTHRQEIITALGAKQTDDGWDFTNAKKLALFCNGPWCDQSPRSIHDLIDLGYPPEKLLYYRGGMQLWYLFGLTVYLP